MTTTIERSERADLLERVKSLVTPDLFTDLSDAPLPELRQIVLGAEAQHKKRAEVRRLRALL